MRIPTAVIPAILVGGLGASIAFGSTPSMRLTAAAAAARCTLTPYVPFTANGRTEIDSYGVLKCRTAEKRRVWTEIDLQIRPGTSTPWFDFAGVDRSFQKGVQGRKSIRISVTPQACNSGTWRTKTILNVGGSSPVQGRLPKGGVTTARFSSAIHLLDPRRRLPPR